MENITMSRSEYIDFLAAQSGEVHFTENNSKLGKNTIAVSFPVVTCRDDAPCKLSGSCYCMQGCQRFAKVQACYYRNLKIYNNNPLDFTNQIVFKLQHTKREFFRWFDAGDMPDSEFIKIMVDIANKTPHIKHMAFTKHYDWINEYLDNGGILPDNLNIIFSAWSKDWTFPNPHGLPVSYVIFKDIELTPDIPKNATGCPSQRDKNITCGTCGKCWNRLIKAVYFMQHGSNLH